MFDLTGQVAVITGSSRGIGRAIAECMARAGAKVVVSSRKPAACEAVADAITANGGEAMVVPCNISERDQLQNLIDQTVARFGRLDILVCNAAVNPYFGPMATHARRSLRQDHVQQCPQQLLAVQHGRAAHGASGGGSIIIVSSIGGRQGSPTLGVYGISKAADFSLVSNLAIEWGARRHSRQRHRAGPDQYRLLAARCGRTRNSCTASRRARPLRRIGEPEDIGGVAVFLASRAAAYLTGQTLIIDGGITIKEPA